MRPRFRAVVPTLALQLLGVSTAAALYHQVFRAVSDSSDQGVDADAWVGWMYVAGVVLQVAAGTVLVYGVRNGPRAPTLRWVLPVWYYFGAWFAFGVAGGLAAREMNTIITFALAAGAWLLACTAHWALRQWDGRPESQADVAAFLASTHMLALIVLVAFAVTERAGQDHFTQQILTGGTFALTVLAMPLCVGLWVRVHVAARLVTTQTIPAPPSNPKRRSQSPRALWYRLVLGVLFVLWVGKRRRQRRAAGP